DIGVVKQTDLSGIRLIPQDLPGIRTVLDHVLIEHQWLRAPVVRDAIQFAIYGVSLLVLETWCYVDGLREPRRLDRDDQVCLLVPLDGSGIDIEDVSGDSARTCLGIHLVNTAGANSIYLDAGLLGPIREPGVFVIGFPGEDCNFIIGVGG